MIEEIKKKITRVGVYGVAIDEEKILLIKQKQGPFAGKYDFPGGGIEFGETPVEALKREFEEEIGQSFETCTLLDNLTAVVEVPKEREKEAFTFYQMGMIYQVNGLRPLGNAGELESEWRTWKTLTKSQTSALLWKHITDKLFQGD